LRWYWFCQPAGSQIHPGFSRCWSAALFVFQFPTARPGSRAGSSVWGELAVEILRLGRLFGAGQTWSWPTVKISLVNGETVVVRDIACG
jgi:hypothetical protein